MRGARTLSRHASSLNSCASEPSAPAPCGSAGLAARLVGLSERGPAKHTCCHAARSARGPTSLAPYLAHSTHGRTKKHLRLMLDDPGDLLFQAALRFANAETLTCGRLSWRKPNGRARALVVGDVFPRPVARGLAQHSAGALQAACMPYQIGFSMCVGTEALYKLLQIATECNPRTTVLSVDAVGGHFYGSESSYTYGPTTLAPSTRSCKPRGRATPSGLSRPASRTRCCCGSPATRRGRICVPRFLDDTYIVCLPERLYDAV